MKMPMWNLHKWNIQKTILYSAYYPEYQRILFTYEAIAERGVHAEIDK